ncbi:U6 small nuclear RNA (adenine-(43)-N(6))-methyltransferase isoform X2 [Macadamia integrifolia]|uniref:U6 small nuclear RNA (adenine-(43)-N(6))-methyltransferase isoform X2 n=1 Tax=Macadamia integrifolia TaxID=60698 RepID=UPI001C4FE72F|nr:U6 small nuclear RNA (adenine-(43)-N(6))-methyltransferase isoform X2 [Macadamia integrifolia]
MPSKKRRRPERPTIHPRNKYFSNPPDFRLLASQYPSFEPYVFYSKDGRPKVDWTDFNATRELTRVLLDHDHGVKWWIPDGQLCPTVPNRSNYIHWIEDLLSTEVTVNTKTNKDKVKGFDIGTGANCIYPLLGASLLGWSFIGSDFTDVALEWAERNVKNNPQISELIEIRKAGDTGKICSREENSNDQLVSGEAKAGIAETTCEKALDPDLQDVVSDTMKGYYGPPVLLGVVKDGENFDFCMCNPPFFESMEEAGLNPKTSCGGTNEEMVCPGGEKAFITRIIEDSVILKQSFRWYTSLIGRKSNLNALTSKLWEVGVTIVKTIEFVQGQTCRWGIAWSFAPPSRKLIASHVGVQRQFSAIDVLKSVESFFLSGGASCKLNTSSFVVDVTASNAYCDAVLKNGVQDFDGAINFHSLCEKSNGPSNLQPPLDGLCFRISVFQQIPGTLLVRGSLHRKQNPSSGAFPLIFQWLEDVLKKEFIEKR